MNFKKTILLTIFLAGFSCSLAFTEIITLSLSNAIELALRNNLSLLQYEKDVKIAEAQYMQSLGDLYTPSISASGSYTYLDPDTVESGKIPTPEYGYIVTNMPVIQGGMPTGGYVPVPIMMPTNIRTNQQVFQDNYSAGITITKPIFTGFKLWNASKIKKLNLELARKKYEDKKREIITTISINFYNLLLIKENIKLLEDLDRSLKERWNYAEASYKAGVVSDYDKIRAEVAYKNNQPNLVRVKNGFITAKIAFCNQLGITNYDEIEVYGNIIDVTNIVVDISLTDAINLAISNDIDLKSIEYNIEILKLSKKITSASRYPTVAAFFNYKYDFKKEKSSDEERKWVDSWNAGVQVSMPIDTLIPFTKTYSAENEMDESIKKLELVRKQVLDGISLKVKNLILQIEQSKALIISQSENVRLAKVGLDLANRRYKTGAASSLELTDSEVSYNQAQVNYLQALYEYFSNVLQLKKTIGY
ncbi:MAG: TolC family protein [Brevinematia bacterium]